MIRNRRGQFAKKRKNKVGKIVPLLVGMVLIIMYGSFTADAMVEPALLVYESDHEWEEKVVLIGTKINWTPDRIKKEYREAAERHGVEFGPMWQTAICENSSMNRFLQSYHKYTYTDFGKGIYRGEREQSYGISQIHLPDHPSVTLKQAQDPAFSAEFMAKAFAMAVRSAEMGIEAGPAAASLTASGTSPQNTFNDLF